MVFRLILDQVGKAVLDCWSSWSWSCCLRLPEPFSIAEPRSPCGRPVGHHVAFRDVEIPEGSPFGPNLVHRQAIGDRRPNIVFRRLRVLHHRRAALCAPGCFGGWGGGGLISILWGRRGRGIFRPRNLGLSTDFLGQGPLKRLPVSVLFLRIADAARRRKIV